MWTSYPVTREGVENGWNLLDLLVKHEKLEPSNRLTNGWLHRMVSAHVECADDELLSARDVLHKIQGYSPVLEIDDKILRILEMSDGHVRAVETSMETQVATTAITDVAQDNVESAGQQQNSMDTEWRQLEQRLHGSKPEQVFDMLSRLMEDNPEQVTTLRLNQAVQLLLDSKCISPSELLVKLNSFASVADQSTYDIVVEAIQQSGNFLEKPVGRMTEQDWNRAHENLTTLASSEQTCSEDIASAWKILDRLVEEEKHGKEHLPNNYESKLQSEWIDRIVEAWCRCDDGETSAANVLVRINSYVPYLNPDPYIYQMIINSVSKASSQEDGTASDSTVSAPSATTKRMIGSQEGETVPETGSKPSSTPSRAPPAEASVMSTTMTKSVYQDKPQSIQGYHRVIRDLTGTRPEHTHPDEAAAKLQEMWDLYNAGINTFKPNVFTYGLVIKAFVNRRHPQSGERAEALLNQMRELADAGDDDLKPDISIFTSVMSAWSNSGHPSALEKVEALFRTVQDLYEGVDSTLKPDVFVYTALLTALSRAGNKEAGDRALAVLNEMHDLHEKGDTDLKPDTVSYNLVMIALTKRLFSDRIARVERAEQLLDEMEQQYRLGNKSLQPSVKSYTIVISAWSKCQESDEAGARAEKVLSRMEAAIAESKTMLASTHPYHLAISAFIRSNDESAAEKAEMILDRLEKADGPYAVPNVLSYNMIITAYAKKGGFSAANRAEALLNRMEKSTNALPNAVTYSKLALAWAKSGDTNAIENAIKYLEALVDLQNDGGAKQEFGSVYDRVVRVANDSERAKLETLKERLQGLAVLERPCTEVDTSSPLNIVEDSDSKRVNSNRGGHEHYVDTRSMTTCSPFDNRIAIR